MWATRRRRKAAKTGDTFVLKLGGPIRWKSLPNCGVFAVYRALPSVIGSRPRPFVCSGLAEFRKHIKQISRSGLREVFVEAAESSAELTDWDYENLVWKVLQGIETIKRRGRRASLLRLRAAIEAKGKRPGPATSPEKNARLIQILAQLAAGKPLKEVAPIPWKPASVSAQLSRFCWDFYQHCNLLGADSPQKWRGDNVAQILKERFGFSFPHDLDSAKEAFRRGKSQLSAEDRKRFDPFPVQ